MHNFHYITVCLRLPLCLLATRQSTVLQGSSCLSVASTVQTSFSKRMKFSPSLPLFHQANLHSLTKKARSFILYACFARPTQNQMVDCSQSTISTHIQRIGLAFSTEQISARKLHSSKELWKSSATGSSAKLFASSQLINCLVASVSETKSATQNHTSTRSSSLNKRNSMSCV